MIINMLEDFDSEINEYFYPKDGLVYVSELKEFPDSYVAHYCNGLDWIPKDLAEIVDIIEDDED